MEYGSILPLRGPLATPGAIARLATGAEELGFSMLAIPDHVIIPNDIESRYPYSADGAFPGQSSPNFLEQLSVLSYLAAITRTARLVTSVMVVPHRNPILAAKMLATADVLSGGRVVVGVGAGWMREEIEALGASYAARGRITDEYIEAMKALWTEAEPRYQGTHVRIEGVTFEPKPVSRPHPPIWVGGESPPAMRRAARLGDAWYPAGTNPRHPLDTQERLLDGLERMRGVAEQAGRDPASLEVALFVSWYHESRRVTNEEGDRRLLTGYPDEVAGDLEWLDAQGVSKVLLSFQRDTLEASEASMRHFVDSVRPLVGALGG